MVPLDMALLSSYRLSIVTFRYCNDFGRYLQILTGVLIPIRSQISPSHGGPGPQSNTALLETTNDIFRPTVLVECTVTLLQ